MNKTCGSYMCGPFDDMANIIGNTAPAGESTNTEGGYWGVVSRD